MLEESIRKYQNRAVETAQILQELIDLAKDMRAGDKRGEELGFTTEELVDMVHENTSIDWTEKESIKAKLRSMVNLILRKYGYPPDKQEKATETVLEQAKLLCADLAA